jgi:hypothetical protein
VNHRKLVILVAIILFSSPLGSFYISAGFQTNLRSTSSATTNCPLSSFTKGEFQYVKNCYYEIGINKEDGEVSYAAITDGSNKSISSQAGLLAEELDIGYGGLGHFNSNIKVPAPTVSSTYVEESISGKIKNSGKVILAGTINMTFFAGEPYFIASLNTTIKAVGTHNSHDIANYVSSSWLKAWAGPQNNGGTEVCTKKSCKGAIDYTSPENTFDTTPDIKTLIQQNGPTWGWLGNSSSTSKAEGIGFLLLGINSTSPDETAITHAVIKGPSTEEPTQVGDWELEGIGVDPSDASSRYLAPHALEYSGVVPQAEYASILVYMNAVPYTTFYNFISGFWKADVVGSFLGSASSYAAFAEVGRSPNLNDDAWYITNLATSVSAPNFTKSPVLEDAMLYFTGRNSSLANDFPMKTYLDVNGLTSKDWNFGSPKATVLSPYGTPTQLQVVWKDPTNGLQLTMEFSTKPNSEMINVSGSLEVTGASGLTASTLALQEDLFANYIDGTGYATQYTTETNSTPPGYLTWNYTNMGIAVFLPSGNGFQSVSSNQKAGYLNLVNSSSSQTYPQGTTFPFSFAVSFFDPVSNFSPAYTQNIYVPTLKLFTQPLGNASEIGFTEDNSQVFSYLESATQFNSNQTIARIQFLKPLSGDLEVYYPGAVNSSVYVEFSNGTRETALSFYNSQTKTFNFNVASMTSASLYVAPDS